MECEDTPDIGDNSGAAWYIWDGLTVYDTQIDVSCPIGKVFHNLACSIFHDHTPLLGQAFDTIYEREVVNQCGAHDNSSAVITWKYNADNTLPACIRK